MVSVLVSLWTPEPPKPLLHTQLELEARVGIELKQVDFGVNFARFYWLVNHYPVNISDHPSTLLC